MTKFSFPPLDVNISYTWINQKFVFGLTGYTPTNDAAIEVAVDGDNYNVNQYTAYSAANAASDGPFIFGRFAYGTPASPGAVGSGANLLVLGATGYNSSTFPGTKAQVALIASETWTTTANGTEVRILVTANGSTSRTTTAVFRGDGTLNLGPNSLGFASVVTGTPDAFFRRAGAAALQLGAANAASPVAQTLQAQGSRAGTDSNVGGASVNFDAGTGTGTGTPATAALRSPVAVASGSGAQTMAAGITAKVGTAVLTNYTVANLPAAATAGAGATAFVTDANATFILGLGLTVVGGGANKVPVYSDGTNWIIG